MKTLNKATITYFKQPAIVKCDRNCKKAWGMASRSKEQLSNNEDDFAYLADFELGDAPVDPKTYEGGFAKPLSPDEFPQKWCVRQCERCAMSRPGEPQELQNWNERVYNLYSRRLDKS